MTRRGQDTVRTRRAVRAATIATVVAAVAATVGGSVGMALASSGGRPARVITRTSAGPARAAGARSGEARWAPVPYRDAQLSVPRAWLVESPPQLACGPAQHGMIFTGARPGFPAKMGCHLTASLAWMIPAGHLPPGIRHRRPTTTIHGIPVYRLASKPGTVRYLVPELGVRVGAKGPLARRVLATLTRSPLAVVLGRGKVSPVPASWTRYRFGGIRFAAPRSWAVQHENRWATCGTGVLPGSLLLLNATRPPVALPCPYSLPSAGAERALPGLTVVTGKYAARSVAAKFGHCQLRNDVRICLAAGTGQGGSSSGVLIFSVARQHQHARTFLLLGLSGSGVRARTIFSSVRASSR
jgi:hypothetical protein